MLRPQHCQKGLPLAHLVATLGQKNFAEVRNPPTFCLGLIFPSAADFSGSSRNQFESKLYDQNHVSDFSENNVIVIVNCLCLYAHNRAHYSLQTELWEVPQKLITLMCKMFLTGAPVKVQCHQIIFPPSALPTDKSQSQFVLWDLKTLTCPFCGTFPSGKE